MKKILFFALLAFGMNAKAQITLEHDYDSAATFGFGAPSTVSQLMIIKFEVSGERYVKINRWGKEMSIYDMNHALINNISLSNLPLVPDGQVLGNFIYISENLFDLDSGIEFMYGYAGADNNDTYTGIYNEDGTLIFSDSAAPMIVPNVPLQQYPIYNTTDGTKMILSYHNLHAKVYSLPGTLSNDIAESSIILISSSSFISNAYPNPTNNTTQIDYSLPEGINEGEIIFYDLQGNEVKRFKVDKTFNTLLVSTSDIASGTYYYQLQTTGQNSDGKKLIVIK